MDHSRLSISSDLRRETWSWIGSLHMHVRFGLVFHKNLDPKHYTNQKQHVQWFQMLWAFMLRRCGRGWFELETLHRPKPSQTLVFGKEEQQAAAMCRTPAVVSSSSHFLSAPAAGFSPPAASEQSGVDFPLQKTRCLGCIFCWCWKCSRHLNAAAAASFAFKVTEKLLFNNDN